MTIDAETVICRLAKLQGGELDGQIWMLHLNENNEWRPAHKVEVLYDLVGETSDDLEGATVIS